MKVFKYEIRHGFYTKMPKGAEPLSVGQQGPSLFCWALVDEDETHIIGRRLAVYGTGHKVSISPGAFLGTIHMTGEFAGLVFHVFDEGEDEQPESENG